MSNFFLMHSDIKWLFCRLIHINFDFSDRDASAVFNEVISLPGTFQFSLIRKGWYICRSIYKNYHRAAIVTDFNVDSVAWLHRCAFTLRPLGENENAQMNCFQSVKPTKPPGIPRISSLSTPSTSSPRPATKPTPHKPEGKIRPGAPNKKYFKSWRSQASCWQFKIEEVLRNGKLFPELTSCCWLYKNATWALCHVFTEIFAPPKWKKLVSFHSVIKFWADILPMKTLGFLYNLILISEVIKAFSTDNNRNETVGCLWKTGIRGCSVLWNKRLNTPGIEFLKR